jgi:hypothetical protein
LRRHARWKQAQAEQDVPNVEGVGPAHQPERQGVCGTLF